MNIFSFLFAPASTEWTIDVAFQSRWDILKIHSRKMNLMRGIDLKKIAEKMNGASGAELKVTCLPWSNVLDSAMNHILAYCMFA